MVGYIYDDEYFEGKTLYLVEGGVHDDFSPKIRQVKVGSPFLSPRVGDDRCSKFFPILSAVDGKPVCDVCFTKENNNPYYHRLTFMSVLPGNLDKKFYASYNLFDNLRDASEEVRKRRIEVQKRIESIRSSALDLERLTKMI